MGIDLSAWTVKFLANLDFWVVIGFVGQTIFMGRLLVQWIASERRKMSHVPKAFWHMSLWGSFIVLAYAIKRADPVFIAGQAFGSVVYIRNLMLWKDDPAT